MPLDHFYERFHRRIFPFTGFIRGGSFGVGKPAHVNKVIRVDLMFAAAVDELEHRFVVGFVAGVAGGFARGDHAEVASDFVSYILFDGFCLRPTVSVDHFVGQFHRDVEEDVVECVAFFCEHIL